MRFKMSKQMRFYRMFLVKLLIIQNIFLIVVYWTITIRSKYYCINYNEFLDMFNFGKASTDIGMEALLKAINVSKDKIEVLVKSRIRKNSCLYYERELVIYGNLIKKVYRYYGLDISSGDIYNQAGFAVGLSVAGIPFIHDFIYIKMEFQKMLLKK